MKRLKVVITTYNLEKYIAEAIESVLNQETNFEYGILIADDASSDGTIKILEDYKKKYPSKIELLLANKNMGSLSNSNRAFDMLETEYFSFLDGDDFWIDKNRLQEQVDFLDNHKEYTMCGANTYYLQNGKKKGFVVPKKFLTGTYSFQDYLEKKVPFVHTSSIVTRNVIYSKGLPDVYKNVIGTFEECAVRGEDFRFLQHLEQGKLKIFDKCYSCYRIHDKGIWQSASETKRKLESAISTNFYRKYWKNIENNYFESNFVYYYKSLMKYLCSISAFKESYQLTQLEHKLLSGLLNDIQGEDIDWKMRDMFFFRYIRK